MMGSLTGFLFHSGPFVSREDSVFSVVLILSVILFVIAESIWVYRKRRDPSNIAFLKKVHERDARLDMLWTVIPAFVLVLLCFVRSDSARTNVASGTEGTRRVHKTYAERTVVPETSGSPERMGGGLREVILKTNLNWDVFQ